MSSLSFAKMSLVTFPTDTTVRNRAAAFRRPLIVVQRPIHLAKAPIMYFKSSGVSKIP